MGYILRAFIGKEENLTQIFQRFIKSKKVNLEEGISMIPMTEELFYEINEDKESSIISSFEFLTENIEQKVLELIESKEVAYIESEFFGGEGGHIGVIWKNGKRDFLTEFNKNSMNLILKRLGVKRTQLKDEFEKVGLLKHRFTENWIQ